MKPGLQIGHTYEFSMVITDVMKAAFEDIEVHHLYSTASMLTHMEWAARQHILPYLEDTEEGFGYHIDIKHLNPTPIGATVRIKSTVMVLEPNRVTSHVEAWNENAIDEEYSKIGDGTLIQAIVPLTSLEKRLGQPASLWEPEN